MRDNLAFDNINTNRVNSYDNKRGNNAILDTKHWLLKRQDIPSSTLSVLPPAIATTSIVTPPTGTCTATVKPKGEEPLSNIAIQSILGGLAAVVMIAVIARCLHVNKQQRSLIETRRHNLASAHAQLALHNSALRGVPGGMSGGATTTMVTPIGTHLVPTNETTLAARLRMYQAQAQSWRDPYPYGQQPVGDVMAVESVSSFVAPSYEQDVSPPPFMNSVGKPPAYAEAVVAVLPPPPPPPASQPQLQSPPQQLQHTRRLSMSSSSSPSPDRPIQEP
ncbi:hypothetical protein BGX23_002123 [Mortierella sp. AD031]|nr:hypothetical protein BGX23_002123 [Mortierella sp. AD031]